MDRKTSARSQLALSGVFQQESEDHAYVNLLMPFRSATAQARDRFPVKYTETRTTSVLDNPADYYISIVRFQVPMSLVPICFMGLQPAGGINDTNYSVAIRGTDGVVRKQFIVWTTEDNVAPVPSTVPVGNLPDQFLPYYSLFSYQHFIDLINVALEAAYVASVGHVGATTKAPFMTFDPVTQQCSISAQTEFGPAGGMKVYFNSELMEFFQGTFQTLYNGFGGLPPAGTSTDYQIIIKDNGNNRITNVPNNPPPAAALAGYEMKQEFAAVILWTDFAGLIFQTGGIAVNPENSAATSASANDNMRPILTDFVPISDGSGVDLRTFITYIPSGEYRLSDMVGTTAIKKLDVQVSWTDTLGNIFPIFVTHNNAVSAKILFRKKTFNKVPRSIEHSSGGASGGCLKCISGGCDSCGGRR